MRYLLFLYSESKALTYGCILFGALFSIGNIGLISIIRNMLFDDLAKPSAQQLLYFILLCMFVSTMHFLSQLIMFRLSQQTTFKLRKRVANELTRISYSVVDRDGTHNLLTNLTRDMPEVAINFARLPMVIINVLFVISCSAYLLFVSYKAALISGAFVGVSVLVYFYFIKKSNRQFRVSREEYAKMIGFFEDLIFGLKELKINNCFRESVFQPEFNKTMVTIRDKNLKGLHIVSFSNSWIQVLYYAFFGLLFFAIAPGLDIDHSVIATFAVVGFFMMTPISNIILLVPMIAQGKIALEHLVRFSSHVEASSHEDNKIENENVFGEFRMLQFKNISYSYYHKQDERFFSLGPLNLTLKPGELVMVIGGNGSGKSTLVKLIVGLYELQGGKILLNDVEITLANLQQYRQAFSVLFSDYHLFGLFPKYSKENWEQIETYLSELELRDKVSIVDGRFSTINLSEGQRKRLALLVAYMEDHPIYIFDEWSANQDPVFRKVFYNKILNDLKKRGKAVLVITHDDAYFDIADRLYKMSDGDLLEQGNKYQQLTVNAPMRKCTHMDGSNGGSSRNSVNPRKYLR